MLRALLFHLDPGHSGSIAVGAGVLSAKERERAGRFVFEKDRDLWSFFRGATRILLARQLGANPVDLHFDEGTHGKPALAPPHDGLHFNLSHTDTAGLLLVCENREVGVDLEPLERGASLIDCVADFCHPDEIARLPSEKRRAAAELIGIWTAKEAFLKALGTGFSVDPRQVLLAGDRASCPDLPELRRLRLVRPAVPGLENHAVATVAPDDVEVILAG